MKKNTLLAAIIVLAITACTIFISDGLTYLITLLMALAIMGTIHHNPSRVMKITRWAKANPKKTQVFITGLQLILMALGIFEGNNLKESGYELSDTTAFVFSIIIVIGFLSVPFLPKRSTIAIPKEVNRHRLAIMCIALSSFVMMVLLGNRIGDYYPNSPITRAVKAMDQVIFPDNSSLDTYQGDVASEPVSSETNKQASTNEPSAVAVFAAHSIYDKGTIKPPTYSKKEGRAKTKAEKKEHRLEKKMKRMKHLLDKYRHALSAGASALAILIILLLLITTCAGICLIIFGISGEIAAGYILLGVLLGGGSIWGIAKLIKELKQKPKTKP